MYAIRSYYAKPTTVKAPDRDVLRLQEELSDVLGAQVEIKTSKSGAGKIQIQFSRITSYNVCYTKLLRFSTH